MPREVDWAEKDQRTGAAGNRSNPPLVGVGIGQILDVSDNHSY